MNGKSGKLRELVAQVGVFQSREGRRRTLEMMMMMMTSRRCNPSKRKQQCAIEGFSFVTLSCASKNDHHDDYHDDDDDADDDDDSTPIQSLKTEAAVQN